MSMILSIYLYIYIYLSILWPLFLHTSTFETLPFDLICFSVPHSRIFKKKISA